MRQIDLFSGIGGFAYAASQVWGKDHEIVAFCEIDKFCQKVLRKNFGNEIPIIDDIHNLKGDEFGTIDLLTGGFPCQSFSQAGARKGREDERALFPEMLRVIREAKPTWIIAENVYGIISIHNGKYFEEICTSLEDEGYTVQPYIIPASAVNAPHKRDRVWIIAYSESIGDSRRPEEVCESDGRSLRELLPEPCNTNKIASNTKGGEPGEQTEQKGRENTSRSDENPTDPNELNGNYGGLCTGEIPQFKTSGIQWDQNWYEVATRLCRMDDGVPRGMDRTNRLKGLGNTIVPQVVMPIMEAIKETDKNLSLFDNS